jgi:FKBP-type peptidyl-prolyl cis-trans isomerase
LFLFSFAVFAADEPAPKSKSEAKDSKTRVTASGLKITDEKVGDGSEARAGDVISVHYTGKLSDGTKFDSSRDRNQPFRFKLGSGQVIKGFDEGLVGMRVGGKRTLVIPPDLGYGKAGAAGGKIPPDATLTFEIELIKVQN